MSEHEKNLQHALPPRYHWPIRRKVDWAVVLTLLGMTTGALTFGIKAVRAHSHWMDLTMQVASALPRLDQDEKEIAVLKNSMTEIRDDVKWLRRHTEKRGGD